MTKPIQEVVDLLRDENLIWSSDFDPIRKSLADLILASAAQGDIMQTLADNLARKILSWDASTVYDPKLEKR